jgi:hypothetical protein
MDVWLDGLVVLTTLILRELTAVCVTIQVLWYVMPRRLPYPEDDRARFSVNSIAIYQTKWRHSTDESNLQRFRVCRPRCVS